MWSQPNFISPTEVTPNQKSTIAVVLVFRTPVSLQTAVGSAIGIGGVFLYSMMKQHYGAGTSTQQIMLSDKPQLTP